MPRTFALIEKMDLLIILNSLIVKDKEGKPVESVDLGFGELQADGSFSKPFPIRKTDKNGQVTINAYIPRFYDDTYKIYIKYNGKEIEREMLIKQNIDEIVIEL